MAQPGLKMGPFHLFVHRKWSKKIVGKPLFFFHFRLIFGPKTAQFQGNLWLWSGQNGLGSFHLFRHPKWSRIIFGKNTFLTDFWSQNNPF